MDDKLKKEILKRLKREPNELERHLFNAMWSEHCGYLHSKKQLQKFKSEGALFADENSGCIKIGDWGVFFKVESHNHPCAVEPYQGAATGIGGIIRDILALGARPIALLNSLKFGSLDNPSTKHIVNGVTSGISDYGNSCGIANAGGEVIFDKCYNDMPIVNVMALGIAPLKDIKLSALEPDLNIVVLGSSTGLDGVGGAAFASKELSQNSNEDKIHVQIGDPFAKKVLIEASLEILKLQGVKACQDCGAAGLLSSTSEMAHKGGCEIELDIDKLHTAQKNMSAAQIMLSETQERMVFALENEALEDVFKIARKYELEVSNIGKSKKGSNYIIKKDGKIAANLPLDVLCRPYLYNLEPVLKPLCKKDEKPKNTYNVVQAVEKIVSSPEFASKKWFYEQWDYAVGNRTFMPPGVSGACALHFYEQGGFIGVCMDSCPRKAFVDPCLGAQSAFFESWRNLISSGFEPKGLTNCLNFANPEKENVKYEFVQSVNGLSDIAKKLDIPIVSGNVSFYNESCGNSIYPSVTIAMTGYCKDEEDLIEAKFLPGDDVYLIGKEITPDSCTGGSLYESILYDYIGGNVDTADLNLEKKLKETIFNLKKAKILNGASDVSKGGLLGTLLWVLFNSGIGFCGSLTEGELLDDSYKLKLLFGEIEGRYIFSSKNTDAVIEYLGKNAVPYLYLGKCIGDKIEFDGYGFNLSELANMYYSAIEKNV